MRAVLFDLDGTLLPLDFEAFQTRYFELLGRRAAEAFPKVDLVRPTLRALHHMVGNDGSATNETRLLGAYRVTDRDGTVIPQDLVLDFFARFYERDFPTLGIGVAPDPEAARVVAIARDRGLRVILATNPVFPATAIVQRMRWAGLEPEAFDRIASMEGLCW